MAPEPAPLRNFRAPRDAPKGTDGLRGLCAPALVTRLARQPEPSRDTRQSPSDLQEHFVELRGFEPMTPSMPWSFVLLAGVADYGLTRGSEELSNAQRGSVLLHVGRI